MPTAAVLGAGVQRDLMAAAVVLAARSATRSLRPPTGRMSEEHRDFTRTKEDELQRWNSELDPPQTTTHRPNAHPPDVPSVRGCVACLNWSSMR